MRISDIILSSTFVSNYNDIKSKLNTLQTQIATNSKIQKPSDSPSDTSSLIQWNTQLTQSQTYSGNVDTASSFVTDTNDTMQSIQTEISNTLTTLSNLSNSTETGNYSNYADQIQQSLNSILSLANTQSNGKYVFGGTENSTSPFGYSADNSAIVVKAPDISGAQVIKTSSSTSQKINLTGTDVFGTIVTQNGSIDSTTSVGNTVSNQTTVYDAYGNPYTLQMNYTKSAANTYSMTYDVLDSSSASVLPSAPAAQTLVFNTSTGRLQTVDGSSPEQIKVNVPGSNINFSIDQSSVKEVSGTTSLSLSANQQNDIFNSMISIVNSLKSGTAPTDAQIQAISDFNERMLDNLAKAGNVTNQLSNTQSLLKNQQTQLNSLISNVQSIDAAKAATDLSNLQYLLDASYQVAGQVMNKTLLDYL
jgi:flagellar hook-associated protein 3 FlgL